MCVNCNDSLQVNLPVGPAGVNGTDGKTILNGTSDPLSGIGTIGDFFLNTVTNTLFGPKTNTGWPTPGTSLVGPVGPAGGIGPIGPQGPLGAFGGVTFEYNFIGFNPAGPASDPGATNVIAIGAGFTTVSQICISHAPVNVPPGGFVGAYFNYIANNNFSTVKGSMKIFKKSDPSAFGVFAISSLTVNPGYTIFNIVAPPLGLLGFGTNAVIAGDDILVSFDIRGDKGNPGNYLAITNILPDPLNANCPGGGVKIELKNGSTNSVIQTEYVCTRDNVAVGMVNWFAGVAPPVGYLLCDGSAVDSSNPSYAALYLAIGNLYDTFNGATAPGGTLFRLPDLRGLFIRGASPGAINAFDPSSPRAVATLQQDALQSHTHNLLTTSGESYLGASTSSVNGSGSANPQTYTRVTAAPNSPATTDVETRPVNVSLLPCIKY